MVTTRGPRNDSRFRWWRHPEEWARHPPKVKPVGATLAGGFDALSAFTAALLAPARAALAGVLAGQSGLPAQAILTTAIRMAGAVTGQSAFVSAVLGAAVTIATLTSANTSANLLTKTADGTIDVIELTSGTYSWQAVAIANDRTARPLTIRPALGALVNLIGPASSDGSIFGLNGAKWITFDGRPGGLGTTSGMIFKNFALAQSGVFQPQGTDHCTFKYLTFQNLSRDGAFSDQPYKSWCFYIFGATNDNMVIDHCWFKTPNAHRDISAIQVASSGSHGSITVSNVMEMDGYLYSWYCERPITNAVLDTWVMSDCGNTGNNKSINFAPVAFSMAGSYQNIHATTSSPYSDTHSGGGTISNGGGNTGI